MHSSPGKPEDVANMWNNTIENKNTEIHYHKNWLRTVQQGYVEYKIDFIMIVTNQTLINSLPNRYMRHD